MGLKSWLFLLAGLAAAAVVVLRGQNIKPRDGHVPNGPTAVTIGEAVMVPIWRAV